MRGQTARAIPMKTATKQLAQRRQLMGFAATLLLLCCLFLAAQVQAQAKSLVPDAQYQPQDVVRIVVDSLQVNDAAKNDDGIATVFNFASPGNRVHTGPLSRFTQMIKRGFPDMLNHTGARYELMEVNGDTAVQAVWLLTVSGAEVGYAFKLSKQDGGEFEGMWMTDAVVPLGKSAQSGTRI